MTPEQWEQIRAHFDAAVELDAVARDEYLARECTDPILRRQVSMMLLADDDEADDLGRIVQGAANSSFTPGALVGTTLGPYRVLEEIDHGGMGSVYLGERADENYDQRVAIKIVNIALAGSQSLSRFKSERQILAKLEHPNIARLIDGGTTPTGAPYLVMEFVDGLAIDDYCNTHKLTTIERLKLFGKVCGAVHVAHQNLIVHRDIKPANILVDAQGTPKLLDFGIAKLLDPQSSGATLAVTQANMRLFTPEYASPEQVQGKSITTASDIYSLGVLLYQLLVGASPYGDSSRQPEALLSAICTKEPSKPSTRVQTLTSIAAEDVSSSRQTTTARLSKRLRGDLDNIVLMALRKEPERRYESALRLAADVDNYLANRPVIARQDTLGYRLSKYARRHMTAVVVASVATVAMISLVTFYTLRLAAERDRAQKAANEATQSAEFLQNLFRVTDPNENQGQQITARALLDQGARQLEVTLADQPGVRAALQTTIGKVYASLGIREEARAVLESALQTLETQGDASPAALYEVLLQLSDLNASQDKFDEGLAYAQRALDVAGRSDSDEILPYRASIHMASVLQNAGRHAESKTILNKIRGALNTPQFRDSVVNAQALRLLALSYEIDSDYGQAEALLRSAISIYEKTYGAIHSDTIMAKRALAFLLDRQREFAASETLFLEVLEATRTLYGDDHPDTALAQGELGTLYRHSGDIEKAMTFLEAGLATSVKVYGEEHSFVAYDMIQVANLGYRRRGMTFAEPIFRKALAIYDRTLPADHPYIASGLIIYASRLVKENRSEEARPHLARGRQVCQAALPPEHWLTAQYDILEGMVERRQGNEALATPLLLGGFERLRAGRGLGHGATRDALKELVENLQAIGDSAGYAKYSALMEDSDPPIR